MLGESEEHSTDEVSGKGQVRTCDTFRANIALARLGRNKNNKKCHPKAVARAIRPIAEVASSKAVREGRSTDAIIF